MDKQILATACLAASAFSSAHAAVVQQAYSGYITGVASATGTTIVGGQLLHTGSEITGTFVYDNAMVGSAPSPFNPLPSKLEYSGAPANNYISLRVDGQSMVTAPDTGASPCSASTLNIVTCSAPVVMRLKAGLATPGLPNDILSLTYTPAYNPALLTIGGDTPVRVSSVTMDFYLTKAWTGKGLPSQINFDELSYAQMTLNLSDGAGVFVKVLSIASPVPEAGTLVSMAAGLLMVAAMTAAQRQGASWRHRSAG
jgi:hypothetical protein